MSVTAEVDKVLALCRNTNISYLHPVYVAPPYVTLKETELHPQYQNGLHIKAVELPVRNAA